MRNNDLLLRNGYKVLREENQKLKSDNETYIKNLTSELNENERLREENQKLKQDIQTIISELENIQIRINSLQRKYNF